MNPTLRTLLFIGLAAIATSACNEEADDLTGLGERNKNAEGTGPGGSGAQGLTCTEGPSGRSYAQFDGTKLEETRENENVGVNRARVKPYAAMEKEFQRVLGVVPPSIKGAGGSFDVPAARWYGETQYSAVSLHAMASISYEGCVAYAKVAPGMKALPTDESAKTECSSLMRKAWSRSPSPEEVTGCTDLAMKTLADEKDVAKRWAYTCASVLSASQFLTF